MSLRPGIKECLTAQTRQAPEILVLQIRAVAPPHQLHCNEILSGPHKRRNIEFRRHLAVLAVSDKPAVDPNLQIRCGRTHMQIDSVSLPAGGKHKRAAVGSDIVVYRRHMRRIGLKLAVPCIFFPTIHGHTESIQFPQSGHAEFRPFRIVEIHPVEIRRPLIQMLDKFKFPFPVEREESVRLRFIGGIRLFLILIC